MAPQPAKLAKDNDISTRCIPFLKPPLQYDIDSGNGGQGADKDLAAVIDKRNQYDKSAYVPQTEHKGKISAQAPKQRRPVHISNIDPTHLAITDFGTHNPKEVCEHPNSVGWDMVSTKQGLFCDISELQLYPLCTDTLTSNCFQFEAMQLRTLVERDGNFAVHGRGCNTTAH